MLFICILVCSSFVYGQGQNDCSFDVQYTRTSICEGDDNTFSIRIDDAEGGLFDVYVDDEKINEENIEIVSAFALYTISVPGDGLEHHLNITKVDDTCVFSATLVSLDCASSCPLSALEVVPYVDQVTELQLSRLTLSSRELYTDISGRVKVVSTEDNDGVTFQLDNESFALGPFKSGDEEYVHFNKPGEYTFTLNSNTSVAGRLHVRCPNSGGQSLNVSFQNSTTSSDGYLLKVDGFLLSNDARSYSATGSTSTVAVVPADGLVHSLQIYDVKSQCIVAQEYHAGYCDSSFGCRLRLNETQLSRCDGDLVSYQIDGMSINDEVDMVELYHNGAKIGIYEMENRRFATNYDLVGDGTLDTIAVYNGGDFSCTDSLIFTTPNCKDTCQYVNLDVEGGKQNPTIIDITSSGMSDDVVLNEIGQQIYFSQSDEAFIGVRSVEGGKVPYDSGLQPLGYLFIPPLLPVGLHEYEVYTSDTTVTHTGRILVSGIYEDPLVTLEYSLFEVNGSQAGYHIYLDGVRYTEEPRHYNLEDYSIGSIIVMGDDKMHRLVLQDVRYPAIRIEKDIFLPVFRPSQCNSKIDVLAQDSCYNNDTYKVDVTFQNEYTLTDRCHIYLDNAEISEFPILYDSTNTAKVSLTLKGDGSAMTFMGEDAFDLGCKDSIKYTSKVCSTPCTLSDITLSVIDDAYYDAHTGVPLNFVGCIDSIQYVAVSFLEKYCDFNSFSVLIDGEMYGSYAYASGDGRNTQYVPLYGDGKQHTIKVRDGLDGTCSQVASVVLPECYNPCNVAIAEVKNNGCDLGIVDYEIFWTDDSNISSLDFKVDGDNYSYTETETGVKFTLEGDSTMHEIRIGSSQERDSLCFDVSTIETPYCLTCAYNYNVEKIGDCRGDTVRYAMQFSSFSSDSIVLVTPLRTIGHDFLVNGTRIEFDLLGNGYDSNVMIQAGDDPYCMETFEIEVEDCSPNLCDVDFSYSVDGYKYTFEDASNLSEAIKEQYWTIGDNISFSNLDKISYTFDSIGRYNVCREVVTDSCENKVCKEIEVKDPCELTKLEYDIDQSANVVQIMNTNGIQYDEMYFDFGDGTVITDETPRHIYTNTGEYKICGFATYAKYNCRSMNCKDVVVEMTAVNEATYKNAVLYPNPVHLGEDIYITSSVQLLSGSIISPNGNVKKVLLTPESTLRYRIKNDIEIPGVYILNLITRKGSDVHKIVVVR